MVTIAQLEELERRYLRLAHHFQVELAVQAARIAELSAEIAELEQRLGEIDDPPEHGSTATVQ